MSAISAFWASIKKAEFYQITLGGSAGSAAEGAPAIGDVVGAALPYDGVVDAVETLVKTYLAVRAAGETFLQAYRRVGLKPFKEALYGRA